jgi:hypothetical protein
LFLQIFEKNLKQRIEKAEYGNTKAAVLLKNKLLEFKKKSAKLVYEMQKKINEQLIQAKEEYRRKFEEKRKL